LNASSILALVNRSVSATWRHREVGFVQPTLNETTRALAHDLIRFGAVPRFGIAHEVEAEMGDLVPRILVVPRTSRASGFTLETCAGDLPQRVASWIDCVDPASHVMLVGSPFTSTGSLHGRRVYGWRRPRWGAWEDKTTIDERLARLDIPTPPHVVRGTETSNAEIGRLCREMDGGDGVILSAGAERGDRGASSRVWWLKRSRDLDGLWARIGAVSASVRIARFVPGVPCSVLGMVLQDGVAVFDPIEIVSLSRPASGPFSFCGSNTLWRPPREDRDAIRHHAGRIGKALAREVGYLGLFSVDGVLGPGGFAVTEVNPRHASGLGLRAGWGQFPIYLFNRAIQEDEAALRAISSRDIERTFRSAIRAAPSLSITIPVDTGFGARVEAEPVEREIDLTLADGTRSRARYLSVGASVRLTAVCREQEGAPLGPVVAALARHVLGTPIHGHDTWARER